MLLSVFRHNFAEASHARDSSATSRFFKLFPAIGWEAEGLDAYATFVVELVRARSPTTLKSNFGFIGEFDAPDFIPTASSPLYYITSLTSLFESIAMIVDQHQPVVDKYYGHDKMKNVVLRLLEEADRVTEALINRWEEDRSIQRKVKLFWLRISIIDFCGSFQKCPITHQFPCFHQIPDANLKMLL